MFWLIAAVFNSSVWAASLGGQASFISTPIEGQLHIDCQEGGTYDHRYVWCEDNILLPFEYAYFNGEAPVEADRVELACDRADGKKVTKSSGYDSTKGRSTADFNLWINTVFQTPLLGIGKNVVHYELKQSDRSVQKGEFEVAVQLGATRVCPSSHVFTPSLDDCRFTERMCARYFRSFNYCQP